MKSSAVTVPNMDINVFEFSIETLSIRNALKGNFYNKKLFNLFINIFVYFLFFEAITVIDFNNSSKLCLPNITESNEKLCVSKKKNSQHKMVIIYIYYYL